MEHFRKYQADKMKQYREAKILKTFDELFKRMQEIQALELQARTEMSESQADDASSTSAISPRGANAGFKMNLDKYGIRAPTSTTNSGIAGLPSLLAK